MRVRKFMRHIGNRKCRAGRCWWISFPPSYLYHPIHTWVYVHTCMYVFNFRVVELCSARAITGKCFKNYGIVLKMNFYILCRHWVINLPLLMNHRRLIVWILYRGIPFSRVCWFNRGINTNFYIKYNLLQNCWWWLMEVEGGLIFFSKVIINSLECNICMLYI